MADIFDVAVSIAEQMKRKGIEPVSYRNADGEWVLPASEYDPADDVYEEDYKELCRERGFTL